MAFEAMFIVIANLKVIKFPNCQVALVAHPMIHTTRVVGAITITCKYRHRVHVQRAIQMARMKNMTPVRLAGRALHMTRTRVEAIAITTNVLQILVATVQVTLEKMPLIKNQGHFFYMFFNC